MSETTESPEPEDAPDDEPDEESTDSEPTPQREAKAVMLLGSGELSRELTLAFQRLGREVVAVDRYANAPAHGVADRAAVVRMNDAEALTAIIDRANPLYVVAESGVIAVDALVAAAERGLEVFPTPRSVRMTQDREGMRRLAADELGLPTAPFWFAGSVDELTAVAEHAGFPLVVKPVAGVPGEGQSVLLRTEDVEAAWRRAVSAGRVSAQQGAGRDRGRGRRRDHLDHGADHRADRTHCTSASRSATATVTVTCWSAWQPQQMSAPALDAAKSIAARIVNARRPRCVRRRAVGARRRGVLLRRLRPHD